MIKIKIQILSEQFQRMSKLAGLLNENELDEIRINNPSKLSSLALGKIKQIFPDAYLVKDWLNRGEEYFRIFFFKKDRQILNLDQLSYDFEDKKFNVSLGPDDLIGRYFKHLDNAIKYLKDKYNSQKNLDEIRINEPTSKKEIRFWESLGPGFTYDKDDEYFVTPEGLMFFYDEKNNKFEIEIQYGDYGDDEDENEETVTNIVDELENILIAKKVQYDIENSSWAVDITIYI